MKRIRMKRGRCFFTAAIASLGIFLWGSAAYGADIYSQWTHSCTITLNTMASGANVATTQTGFPVLVRLTSSNFAFAEAKSGGLDIRFAKSDNTHIPYQIERWDNATSTAEIWLKADVLGNNNAPTITMYWGKSDAADSSSGNAVFGTANGFVAVYHLNEGGIGTRNNSAQGLYPGTPQNYTGTESVIGMMARGDSLGIATVTGDGIQLPNIDLTGKPITLSAWVKLHTTIVNQNGALANGWNNYGKIISQPYYPTAAQVGVIPYHAFSLEMDGNQLGYLTGPHVQIGIAANATTWSTAVSLTPLTADVWSYVAGTLSLGTNGQLQMYLNGTADNIPTTVVGSISNPNAQVTTIGYNAQSIERFNGVIDEVRIENQARSADWIKLCYQSQKPDASWLTFASVTLSVPAITTNPSNTTVTAGQTAAFTVVATGGGLTYQWQRYNGTTWPNAPGASTSSTYSFTAAYPADSGAQFRCYVSNTKGNATSNPATLTVNAPLAAPVITTHPQSATRNVGQSVTFTVVATGNPTPGYQWRKGGTAIPGQNAASYTIASVILGDAGNYDVVVSNSPGTVTSNPATLTVNAVLAAPVITAHPQSATRNVSQSVTFTVVATGNPTPGYQWRKGGGAIPGANAASYSIASVIAGDAGSYDVVVTNSQGTVTSNPATLTVIVPLKAAFTVSDTAHEVPATITFTDVSAPQSAVTKRYWIFSDGSVDSSNAPVVDHRYTTANVFKTKLFVFGNGTVDSASQDIYIWVPTQNPILLAGKYTAPQQAEITFSNYGSIRTVFPPPFADSVTLYYRPGSILPTQSSQASVYKSYAVKDMQAQGAAFKVQVTGLPALTPPDSQIWFMSEILWNDKSRSAFAAQNGCPVLMRDTFTIVNPCNLTGKYLGGDSVVFLVSGMQNIDTALADSFALWYGTAIADSVPDFKSSTTLWFNLRFRFASIMASGGKDSVVVHNRQFNTGSKKTLWAAISLKGINDKMSPLPPVSFPAGETLPDNPIHLIAKAENPSTILLKWDLVTVNIDRIVIWYRKDTPVPLDFQFPGIMMDSVVLPASADSVLVTGLNERTTYCFGAQIFSVQLPSLVTQLSSASATTPGASGYVDSNTVTITSLDWDTVKNELTVNWTVNTVVGNNLEVGIAYAVGPSYPGLDTSVKQHEAVKGTGVVSGSAVIKLWEPLVFTTPYSVALWLRNAPSGKWTVPTPASEAQKTSPHFNWQEVLYYKKTDQTTLAFNGVIRIITDPDTTILPVLDTVLVFSSLQSQLEGFVPVGDVGFSFKSGSNAKTLPLTVGLHFDVSKVPNQAYNSVRIYRWDQATSSWRVEPGAQVDPSTGYVSVKTNDLRYPFVAMVDVQRVKVVPQTDTGSTLNVGQTVTDIFEISDNVANVSWKFLCATGGDSLVSTAVSQQGVLTQNSQTIQGTITQDAVSQDNGARAILIVSDGVNTDTVNVSRQVWRDRSDYTKINFDEAGKWVPLRVTATLDSPLVKQAMRSLLPAGQAWSYDQRVMRVFRWFPNTGNAGKTDKWVEYADDIPAFVFSFQPGTLFWLKSGNEGFIDFGRGLTPSLKVPDTTVELAPNEWTDMALPFQFNMYIGDIIAATVAKTPNAAQAEFYRWQKDPATGAYYTFAQYIAAFTASSLDKPDVILSSDLKTGYAVFNPTSERIVLRIPAVPTGMSKAAVLTKKTSEKGWAVRIDPVLEGGSRLSPVYCGFAPSKGGAVRYFALAPSFSNVYAAVCDKPSKSLYGHALMQSMPDGGCAYLLAFCNGSETSRKIAYRLQVEGELEKGMKAVVFDEGTGQFEASSGQGSVAVASGGREYRWLFVGNEAYLSKAAVLVHSVKLDLLGVYANGYGRSMRIRYSVPGDGVSRIQFELYDVSGRLVWQTGRDCRTVSGVKELVWDGKTTGGKAVACGIYVLRMVSFDARQSPFAVFERKMTFMP
jgi:predicted secreted protein